MTREEIITYLKEEIALSVGKDMDDIADDVNFMRLGLSSVQSLKIINKLRKKMNVEINPVAMFEFKTISDFAGYLTE